MDRACIGSLPEWADGLQYLYAAMRSDGVCKIGRTVNPRSRLAGLYDTFRRTGTPMVGAYVVRTPSSASAEKLLANVCAVVGRPVRGREYFAGLSWDVIKPLVRAAARA